jgi:hypothetical protein
MNQGTQRYSLTKKTEGRKSRDTVPLIFPCMDLQRFSIQVKVQVSNESIMKIMQA